jgi:hypothetical protein
MEVDPICRSTVISETFARMRQEGVKPRVCAVILKVMYWR